MVEGLRMYAIRMLVRVAAVAVFAPLAVQAQELTITNARIIVGNGEVIENGSLIVRGGKIASVAAGKPAMRHRPPGA
jgi:imidazolonepropionase-like amidohydrolase